MGKMIRLKAKDGHELDAYLAEPKGEAKGGIVVVQEIFGVTNHIKRVADQYAAQGYRAIAPAMFDRVERNVTLDYSQIQKGLEYMQQLKWPNTLADLKRPRTRCAAPAARPSSVTAGAAPSRTSRRATSMLDAAISYYGGGVAKMLDKKPRCPIVYHFGDKDASIPLPDIEKIKKANPKSPVFVYPGAGHGFNCDERGSYSAKDAKIAFERSLEFLHEQTA